jgi:hypothetical protein
MKIALLIILTVILFTNCMVLRSAKGLEPGEFQIGYTPLNSGNIRLGILKNVESRYLVINESQAWDILFHLNKDKFSYGVSSGVWYNDKKAPNFHSSLIISKSVTDDVSPYFAYVYVNGKNKYEGFFSLGVESYLAQNDFPISMVMTPEFSILNLFNKKKILLVGAINIGLNFNFFSNN